MQLEFIRWIQQIRTPELDLIFKGLNYLDRIEFTFVLIPILWYTISRKVGIRMFYCLAAVAIVNGMFKLMFQTPRPFHLDPSLGVIRVGGYGFPSGAAQTAMFLSCALLDWKRNWITYLGAAVYFSILSFSRLYLGVHFPIDLVGGWFVGVLLFLGYKYGLPGLENKLAKISPKLLMLVGIGLPFLFLILYPCGVTKDVCPAASAIALGYFLTTERSPSILRAFLAILGVFLLYIFVVRLSEAAASFAAGLWLSTAPGLLIKESAYQEK